MTQGSLADFAVLSHANAMHNPNAMYHRPLDRASYERSEMISHPLNRMDMAAYADGAAAVILARPEVLSSDLGHALVRVTGSSLASDTLALHDRQNPLEFGAAAMATDCACRKAGILPTDVDFFEVYGAFSVYAILALEASGFAPRGEGYKLLQKGMFGPKGKLPICTLGGEKGRGNPLGATGLYQVVEAALQLRGEAGDAQVRDASRALVQTLAGPASTAVTHVLERYPSAA
jgi:acetyl-CoA C-acetyltransferase